MKKFVAILAAALMTSALFISCAKKGTCAECGTENVTLKTVEVMGQKADVCENCAEGIEAAKTLLGL